MVNDTRSAVVDFGFDPRVSTYHFALVVERDAASVHVEERFDLIGEARSPELGEPLRPILKATLDAYRWSRIADHVRAEFNRRITAEGARAARWRPEETVLAPHMGKELTLLFWVVEDADPTIIPNMVANWVGLAPEERWWLYTTVNATAGHPEHGRDRGWRKAVKIALAENPAATATPGGWLTRGDADRPEVPTKRTRGRLTRRTAPEDNQLPLLPDEKPVQLPLMGARENQPEGAPE